MEDFVVAVIAVIGMIEKAVVAGRAPGAAKAALAMEHSIASGTA
ncbi:hypothetical protein [Variovorax sp. RHLX14]